MSISNDSCDKGGLLTDIHGIDTNWKWQ